MLHHIYIIYRAEHYRAILTQQKDQLDSKKRKHLWVFINFWADSLMILFNIVNNFISITLTTKQILILIVFCSQMVFTYGILWGYLCQHCIFLKRLIHNQKGLFCYLIHPEQNMLLCCRKFGFDYSEFKIDPYI